MCRNLGETLENLLIGYANWKREEGKISPLTVKKGLTFHSSHTIQQ